jgi:GR25 family glycosyltransferase involved in LPS biosynthesis
MNTDTDITNKLPCYIIHYTKNRERFDYLVNEIFPVLVASNLFSKLQIITDLDKQHEIVKQKTYNSSLSRAQNSCTSKHFLAWNLFSNSEYQNSLVLEDDILFEERLTESPEEIIKELENMLSQLTEEHNFITLGAGLHQHADSNGLTKKTYGRSTDSYIISRKFLEYHDEKSFTFDVPIGHYIDRILNENNDFLWWFEPTIFRQGTHNNIYESNISKFYKLQKLFNV